MLSGCQDLQKKKIMTSLAKCCKVLYLYTGKLNQEIPLGKMEAHVSPCRTLSAHDTTFSAHGKVITYPAQREDMIVTKSGKNVKVRSSPMSGGSSVLKIES